MDVPTLISELDDYGFADTSSVRKVSKIQETIDDIESREPWPFLQTSMFFNFDGSSDIPTNFPADFGTALRLKDLTNGRRIKPIRLDDFEDIVGMDYSLAGDPIYYYFDGNNLKVWPIPPASSSRMKFRYLKWSARINSSSAESAILIPPRYHEIIVFGTFGRLYFMEDDIEVVPMFYQDFEAKIQNMKNDVFQQQFDAPDMVHVTDPDDWDFSTY